MSKISLPENRHAIRLVFGLGAVIWGLLVWILLLGESYQYEVPNSERPILLVTSLLFTASVISIMGVWLGLKIMRTNRSLLPVIVVFAISFRLVQLFAPPFQEVDSYRYIWDGITSTSGVSPYRYSPHQVLEEQGQDEQLNALQNQVLDSPAQATILSRVHFAQLKTIYPPVSQAVFAATVFCIPGNASVSTYLLAMKFSITLFDLATFFLLVYLLTRLKLHPAWSMLYGWNPLVIKEFSNSGHLDSIAIFLVLAAVVCLLKSIRAFDRTEEVVPGDHRLMFLVLSAVLLALGVASKIYPIILAPYLAMVLVRRSDWFHSILFCCVFVLIAVATLFPMLQSYGNSSTADQAKVEDPSEQPTKEGLTVFLKHWQINEWAFMLVYQNLREIDPEQTRDIPWFRLPNEAARKRIVSFGALFVSEEDAANFISRVITLGGFGLFYLCLAIMAWRRSRWRAEPFLADCFWIIAIFFCLQPTQNPWYWIWALPFLPFTRNRGWILYSPLLLIYYLRFWLATLPDEFNFLGFTYTGMGLFDFVIVWIEHLPVFLGVVCWFHIKKILSPVSAEKM